MAELERALRTQILLRNDTAERWSHFNPILGKGEIGYENDTNKIKIGNNVDSWNNLPYFGGELKVDEKSIQLIDGELSLVGIQDVAESGYMLVSDGKGGIQWVKPDTTTVEGLATEIETLGNDVKGIKEDVKDLQEAVETKAEASALDSYALKADVESTYATKEEIKNYVESSVVEGIDSRVQTIENDYVKSVSYDESKGIFTFTTADGVQTYDLAIEKVVTNFTYDSEKVALVLQLADGNAPLEIPMSAFLNVYTPEKDATEVQINIVSDQISAALVNGGVTTVKVADKAITEAKLADEVVVKLEKGVAAEAAVATKAEQSVVTGIESRVGVNEQAIVTINESLKDKLDEAQVNTLIAEATIEAGKINGVVEEAKSAQSADKLVNSLKVTVDGETTEFDGSAEQEVVINIASAVEAAVNPVVERVEALEKDAAEYISEVKVNGVALEKSTGSVDITKISTDMLVQGTKLLILDGGNAE
jgi:hypothetical protein